VSGDQKAAKLKRAEAILKRARAEEDFAILALAFSNDMSSRAKGGEYLFARGQLVPEVEKAAFSMKTNQISDIVTSADGYHIIKLIEKIPAHKIKYADAVADIKATLAQHEIDQQSPEYLARLRREAGVEILDEALKPQEDSDSGFSLPSLLPQPEKSPPAK
jgi:parvulin-like peptidyl-prolyl isomerase